MTKTTEADSLYAQAEEFMTPIGADGQPGLPNDEQEAKAFDLLLKAVDLGHLEAHVDLYYCYAQGMGPVEDVERGLEVLTKAADQGLCRAQVVLGAHWGADLV